MFSAQADKKITNRPWRAGGAVRLGAALLVDERDRWVLWAPVGVGIGIGIYFSLPVEPSQWLGPAALITAVAVVVAGKHRTVGVLAALVLLGPAAGFTAAQLRTALTDVQTLQEEFGPRRLVGQVRAVQDVERGYRLVLSSVTMAKPATVYLPPRIRIRTPKSDWTPMPGDWVQGLVVLYPPPPPVAPHAFDFERYAYFEGIGALGYSFGKVTPTVRDGAPDRDPTLLLSTVRRQIYDRIVDALPGPIGSVAGALITGERGSIPAAILQAMRDSGLAHLLAISGLHIGLVAGIIFVSSRALLAATTSIALRFPIKKWAAAIALVGAFGYLLLSGMTVPTQRAFLMIGLVLLAVMADREGVSMRLVAYAATVVLLVAPEKLLSASFQMSFAAVVALVAVYENLRDRFSASLRPRSWWRRPLLYLAGVALTTVVASMATMPYAAFHFGRIVAYGLAANVIAVPITALWIMPWGLVALCLMPFGLEQLALIPMGWGISAVLATAETVSSWHGAVHLLPKPPDWALLLVTAGGLWLCLWRRRWRIGGVPIILVGLFGFSATNPPSLLVTHDAKLVAVRDHDGVWLFSSGRREAFVRESWLRLVGSGEWRQWPEEGSSEGGALRCDRLGCLYSLADKVIAIVRDPRAAAEDCAIADAVLALVPLDGRCRPRSGMAIDRFDLWRNGSYEIRWEKGGLTAYSSRARRGSRPWVGLP